MLSLNNYVEKDRTNQSFYESSIKTMEAIVKKCSHIARVYQLGTTSDNKKIIVLQMAEDPGKRIQLRPDFALISDLLGHNQMSRHLILKFGQWLCDNYDNNDSVKYLIKNTRVHLIPSFYANDESINLNDFDSSVDIKNNERLENIMFFKEWISKLSLTLVGQMIDAPFKSELSSSFNSNSNSNNNNNKRDKIKDNTMISESIIQYDENDIIKNLLRIYYDNVPPTSFAQLTQPIASSASSDTSSDTSSITESCVDESILDQSNQLLTQLLKNTIGVTLRVGCGHSDDPNSINQLWNANKDALVYLMSEIHRGIKGVVINENAEENDEKFLSNVTIQIDNRATQTFTSKLGDYWRILLPGSYNLELSKEGYKTVQKKIVVKEGLSNVLNFSLKKL